MYEKVFLESLQDLQALGLKLCLTQMFSCEFYEISKTTPFTE